MRITPRFPDLLQLPVLFRQGQEQVRQENLAVCEALALLQGALAGGEALHRSPVHGRGISRFWPQEPR